VYIIQASDMDVWIRISVLISCR